MVPQKKELNATEAAEILGVSHLHVNNLLDEGVIPCRQVDGYRRVSLVDVLNYQAAVNKKHALLDEMSLDMQNAGMYELR